MERLNIHNSRRTIIKPSIEWLLIELLVSSILCIVPMLWDMQINKSNITQSFLIAIMVLLPSEFLRQYVGFERLKIFFLEIRKQDTNDIKAQFVKEIFTNRKIIFVINGFVLGLLFITVSFNIKDQKSSSVAEILGVVFLCTTSVMLLVEYLFVRERWSIKSIVRETIPHVYLYTDEGDDISSGLAFLAARSNRHKIKFPEILDSAKNEIKILGTEISYWYDLPYIQNILKGALDRGCKVKMLFLDPKSIYAKERASELQINGGSNYIQRLENNFENIKKIDSRIEIKSYMTRPSSSIVIVDDIVIVSFILKSIRGRNSFHFMFVKTPWKERKSMFEEEFNFFWNKNE